VSGPRILSVAVVFAEPIPAGGGTVRVVLEDTTRADAAATVVAQSVEPLTRPLAAGGRLPFRLTVPELDEHARYNVRVHVDRSGSGEISAGDRITTRAYPVLTQGAGDHVEVEVVEI
jgi:putative lipoprotein